MLGLRAPRGDEVTMDGIEHPLPKGRKYHPSRILGPRHLARFPTLPSPCNLCIPAPKPELAPASTPLAAATVTRQSNPKTSAHNAPGGPGKTRRVGEGEKRGASRAGGGRGQEAKKGPNCRRAAEHYLIP